MKCKHLEWQCFIFLIELHKLSADSFSVLSKLSTSQFLESGVDSFGQLYSQHFLRGLPRLRARGPVRHPLRGRAREAVVEVGAALGLHVWGAGGEGDGGRGLGEGLGERAQGLEEDSEMKRK